MATSRDNEIDGDSPSEPYHPVSVAARQHSVQGPLRNSNNPPAPTPPAIPSALIPNGPHVQTSNAWSYEQTYHHFEQQFIRPVMLVHKQNDMIVGLRQQLAQKASQDRLTIESIQRNWIQQRRAWAQQNVLLCKEIRDIKSEHNQKLHKLNQNHHLAVKRLEVVHSEQLAAKKRKLDNYEAELKTHTKEAMVMQDAQRKQRCAYQDIAARAQDTRAHNDRLKKVIADQKKLCDNQRAAAQDHIQRLERQLESANEQIQKISAGNDSLEVALTDARSELEDLQKSHDFVDFLLETEKKKKQSSDMQ